MTAGLSSYSADHFLALDQSSTDADHPDHLATVEEGIRFPPAQIRTASIELYNNLETALLKRGSIHLPQFHPSLRVNIVGRDGELMINSYPQQTITMQQKTRSRRRIRYGTTRTVCTNIKGLSIALMMPEQAFFRAMERPLMSLARIIIIRCTVKDSI